MVYIRVKKIKGRKYYYLVKSVRKGGKVKQLHIKYLGQKFSDEEIKKLKEKYKHLKSDNKDSPSK